MEIINLTPHDINIYDTTNGSIIFVFSNIGKEVRLKSQPQSYIEDLTLVGSKIPIYTHQKFIELEFKGFDDWNNLNVNGVIVSLPVAQFLQQHPELQPPYSVYTIGSGPNMVVRNLNGSIVGTKGLEKYL